MKIEEIDKNLFIETNITEPDIVWLNIRQAPFVILGIDYDEKCGCYTRMPQELAEQISKGVAYLNSNTAGGRVRFRTDSEFIGIRAVMDNNVLMPHITLLGQSGFDLYRKKAGENSEKFYHSFVPPMGMSTGYSAPFNTDGVLADYTINFPLYDGVKELYIALKKDAVVLEPIIFMLSFSASGIPAKRGNSSFLAIFSSTFFAVSSAVSFVNELNAPSFSSNLFILSKAAFVNSTADTSLFFKALLCSAADFLKSSFISVSLASLIG